MTPNITNLLLSLASAIATIAGCEVGVDLFVHRLPSSQSNSATGVGLLRAYPASAPGGFRRIPELAIQVMAQATTEAAAIAKAQAIYEALHYTADDDAEQAGRPRSAWSIDAKTLDSSGDLVADTTIDQSRWEIRYLSVNQTPGIISTDDAGRVEAGFNFDVYFSQPTAA